jgi:hypothetical protein
MGIQIFFDTDGITDGSVEDPNDQVVFSLRAVDGSEDTHDVRIPAGPEITAPEDGSVVPHDAHAPHKVDQSDWPYPP